MSDHMDNGSKESVDQVIGEDMVPEDRYPEMDESLSDVVFVIDGHRIPAVKAIFGFKSLVFRAMFSVPLVESTASVIDIDDPMITVNAFKAMRRFIYTEVVAKDTDLICDVIICAHKYQVMRLFDKMAERLSAMLTTHTVTAIAEMAVKYDNKPLMDSVKAFIMNNSSVMATFGLEYVSRLNDMTGGTCLEAMVESVAKTRKYFTTRIRCLEGSLEKLYKEGNKFCYKSKKNNLWVFDFDNMADN